MALIFIVFFTNAFKGGAFIENGYDFYSSSPLSNSYFGVGFNGLTKEACITLATYDWGDKSSSGLIGYGVAAYDTLSMPIMYLSEGTKNKGCFSDSSAAWCLGQAMPVTLAAQKCNCYDSYGCSIYWLYQ